MPLALAAPVTVAYWDRISFAAPHCPPFPPCPPQHCDQQEDLRCEDVTQLSPDDDRCDYARANCHVESLLNYPVIYYCHVQPHGPLLAALMAVSMRGSMAEQLFGLTENVQRWSLDHTPSDNMGNSFKSVDMMGRSGSGISAFTKIDGAPTNQAPGIQINPVQLCKRENRESD